LNPTTILIHRPRRRRCRSRRPQHPPSPTGKRGSNFYLADDRGLARGWKERARDNVAAIRLAVEIEADERPATAEEQEQLIRFTGFGASDLANGVFRRPGEVDFRKGWDDLGTDLEDAVGRGRLCLARPLHPICPFYAGVHRPGDLGGP
jgi:adenine-specific DNA methylase